MGGCGNLIKYFFAFVNLVILVGGAVLLGIGISSLVGDNSKISNLISTELYTGTAILIIVAGSIIVIISFLGCCGAFWESKCLLGTFFCLVFIMFVLTVAGAVTAFVMGTDSILNEIETDLKDTLKNYDTNEATRESWDALQQDFECCGVGKPDDWDQRRPKGKPASCYKNRDQTKPLKLFKNGCLTEVKNFISNHSKLFGGVAIGVVIFLFVSMVFSCAICKSIR